MKILATSVLLIIITFTFITFNKAEKINTESNIVSKPLNLHEHSNEFVKKKLSEMTLREKIAQMIVANAVPENFSYFFAEVKKLKKL